MPNLRHRSEGTVRTLAVVLFLLLTVAHCNIGAFVITYIIWGVSLL